MPFEQVLVPQVRDPGKVKRGLRLLQGRAGLVKLLVNLRGIDLGQEIACLYLRADIEVPFFQVTVGLSVDRGLRVSLGVARQVKLD